MSIPQWHYKVEEINISGIEASEMHNVREKLDKLGMEGWEAVAPLPTGIPGRTFVLFKRQSGVTTVKEAA